MHMYLGLTWDPAETGRWEIHKLNSYRKFFSTVQVQVVGQLPLPEIQKIIKEWNTHIVLVYTTSNSSRSFFTGGTCPAEITEKIRSGIHALSCFKVFLQESFRSPARVLEYSVPHFSTAYGEFERFYCIEYLVLVLVPALVSYVRACHAYNSCTLIPGTWTKRSTLPFSLFFLFYDDN
jgi:hypothetical protein